MRRIVALAFVAMSIGCTNPEPKLTGIFGGGDALLDANSTYATFVFGCRQVVLDPIRLQPDGHATMSGNSITPDRVWAPGEGDPTTVELRQIDQQLLDVTVFVQGQPDKHYQLRRDTYPLYQATCATTASPGVTISPRGP